VYLVVNLFFGDIEYQEPETSGVLPGSLLLWGTLQPEIEPDFAAVTAGTHLGQALWAVGLAAAGLILFATSSRRVRAAAIVPVVLGAAVAVPLLPERYADAYYLDPGATALVCTPDTPRVCMMRAHESGLASLRGPAREALAVLAAKLPDPPTSVVEQRFWLDSPPAPRADTIYVAVFLSGGEVQPVSGTVPDLRWELLLGAGTPGCANAPAPGTAQRRRYDAARLVAAAWLLDREPPPPAFPDDPFLLRQDETVPVYQALLELPRAEQRDRVAALRAAELACDGSDRLEILVGDPG
jgi:hypothetical protein